MQKNYLTISLSALLTLFVSFIAVAQNPVEGKIEVVSNVNNALVVKLSLRAPLKSLGSATIILGYNKNTLALAEDPRTATSNSLDDGNFYYNTAFLNNSDYFQTDFTRRIESEGEPDEAHFSYSNIYYDPLGSNTPVSINSWTEIAVFKFAIVASGTANFAFNLDPNEMILMDNAGNTFDLNAANFTVPTVNLTYSTPSLILTSYGAGKNSNPYVVTLKSSDNAAKPAGTTGFYVYYSSDEATLLSATDKLTTGFEWANGTITDQTIANPISKGGVLYDHRIKYTNNDGTQGDDSWPAANASQPEKALAIVFTALTLDGIKTYLEPINETSYKDPVETQIYPLQVQSPFRTLGVNDPLPVSLVSFSATMDDNKVVKLNWATSSEKNNDRFEIERSSNGREFKTLLTEKGSGTTTDFHAYTTTDTKPLTGLSYYRLKQIDYDGTADYSKVVTINNGSELKDLAITAVYPNPTKGSSNVIFTLASNTKVSLQITNILGQVVKSQVIEGKAGRNETSIINFENLPGGVYFINLKDGTQQAVHKLIKE